MTLLMYLLSYTISNVCLGNHSECARRLGMSYPDLRKIIKRINAGGTSGVLMEALLEMYWRENLSLDTVLAQYSQSQMGSDIESANMTCVHIMETVRSTVTDLPKDSQDLKRVLRLADDLGKLIRQNFCEKYCDRQKFADADCPLQEYGAFVLSLKKEMELALKEEP